MVEERAPLTSRRFAGQWITTVIDWLDGGAVLLFALEGAMLAAAARYDLFGVLVVAVVSALGGGTIRDLLIGDIPPLSVRTSRYVVLALAGGLAAFYLYAWFDDIPRGVLITLDAGGLALFAVAGSAKADEYRLPALICAFIGTLTAVGGGVIRDLLLDRAPVILAADVYASAALLGSAIVVVGFRAGWRRGPTMVAGGAACFVLRLVAAWRHWSLPTSPWL